MFSIGQYVVFGNKGVCRVDKVGPIDVPGIDGERMYYTLVQINQKNSVVYTPVDKENTALRAILSEEAAQTLLDRVEGLEYEWIIDDKIRNKLYTEMLRRADSYELCSMIKALDRRKKERIASGKKPTSTDERFFHSAADILYGELSLALNKDKDSIKAIMDDKIR